MTSPKSNVPLSARTCMSGLHILGPFERGCSKCKRIAAIEYWKNHREEHKQRCRKRYEKNRKPPEFPRGSPGGKARAIKAREEAIALYYLSPNLCKECGEVIQVKPNEKVWRTKERIFCDKKCSAKFNNKIPKKKKKPLPPCQNCGKEVKYPGSITCSVRCSGRMREKLTSTTKKELFNRCGAWQSARSEIQKNARQVYIDSGMEMKCRVCGYGTFVDIAHIKSVASFGGDSLIREINHIDNLVPMCPNHHREFDSGMLMGHTIGAGW